MATFISQTGLCVAARRNWPGPREGRVEGVVGGRGRGSWGGGGGQCVQSASLSAKVNVDQTT